MLNSKIARPIYLDKKGFNFTPFDNLGSSGKKQPTLLRDLRVLTNWSLL